MPPITIAPTNVQNTETDSPARKKTSSVSFSLDSNEVDGSVSQLLNASDVRDETDKGGDTRKNKVCVTIFLLLEYYKGAIFRC